MKTPLSILTLVSFLITGIIGPMPAYAQELRLPTPGVMVRLSPEFNPPILKGIKVHTENPFRFDFILDKDDSSSTDQQIRDESTKLIKYFLASITTPEKDLWVNLSPYEKDRIIPNSFGLTEMGRDLLAQDYMLKQITASLIYPEDEVGKKFWKRIYKEAQAKYGTTNIPVNTFNKVWVVPEKAVVYENAKTGTAYVVESKLKVMIEEDYLSLENNVGMAEPNQANDTNQLGSQIVREIVIPELTKEVNENKNFSQLRQVYNSLILATWYKKKIKDSILSQVYSDKNKVAGVNIDDPQEKQKIYKQYLKAFKKGVYNYIKEDQDPLTQEVLPRKYFSGGMSMAMTTPNFGFDKAKAAFSIIIDQSLVSADSLVKNPYLIEAKTVLAIQSAIQPTSTANTFGNTSAPITAPVVKPVVLNKNLVLAHVKQFIVNAKKEFQLENSTLDHIVTALGERLDLKQAQNLAMIAQLTPEALGLIDEFAHVEGMDNFLKGAQIANLFKFENMMRQLAVAKKLQDDHNYIIERIEADIKVDGGIKNVDIIARNLNKNNESFFEVQLGDRLANNNGTIGTQEALKFLERQIVEHRIVINQVTVGVDEIGDLRAASQLQQKTASVNLIFGPQLTAKLNELQALNHEGLNDLLKVFPQAKLRLNIDADFKLKLPDEALVKEINGKIDGLLQNERNKQGKIVKQVAQDFKMPGGLIGALLDLGASEAGIRIFLGNMDGEKRIELRNQFNAIPVEQRGGWVKNEIMEKIQVFDNAMVEEDGILRPQLIKDPIEMAELIKIVSTVANRLKPDNSDRSTDLVLNLKEFSANPDNINLTSIVLFKVFYHPDMHPILLMEFGESSLKVSFIKRWNDFLKSSPALRKSLNDIGFTPEMARFLLLESVNGLPDFMRFNERFLQSQVNLTKYDDASIRMVGMTALRDLKNRSDIKPLKVWMEQVFPMHAIAKRPILEINDVSQEEGAQHSYSFNTAFIIDQAQAVTKLNEGIDAVKRSDHAMTNIEQKTSAPGGIDLTPANMNLQTQNSNGEIKFKIDPAMLQQLQNAPGFTPVIINIQPMTDLKTFLGLTATKTEETLAKV